MGIKVLPKLWTVLVHSGGVKGYWKKVRSTNKGKALLHWHSLTDQLHSSASTRLLDPDGKTKRQWRGIDWKDEWE